MLSSSIWCSSSVTAPSVLCVLLPAAVHVVERTRAAADTAQGHHQKPATARPRLHRSRPTALRTAGEELNLKLNVTKV